MKVFAVPALLLASVTWQVIADSPATWRQPSLTKTPPKSPSFETAHPYPLASDVIKIRAGAKPVASKKSELVNDLLHRLKIGFYFALWYALNIVYNSKFNVSLLSDVSDLV